MLKAKSSLIAAGILAAIVTGSALAQPSGLPSQPKSQLSNPVEQYLLGQQLYDYGKTNSDVLSVIAAAGIVAKSTPRNVASPDLAGNNGASGAVTKPVADLPTLDDMLATAKALAGQNKMLLALIDDLASGASRGFIPAKGGLTQWSADKYANWGPLDFEGDADAVVGVQAPVGLVLHIVVTDELKTTVCETNSGFKTIVKDKAGNNLDFFVCRWHPLWKGTFNVQVSGGATKDVDYTMIMMN